MKVKSNQAIRTAAKENGIELWRIANKLGINDGNFSRKLRYELSEDEKQKILEIINELAKE